MISCFGWPLALIALSIICQAKALETSSSLNSRPASGPSKISTKNGKQPSTEVPPIEIKGNKFFYSNNGSQFLMKGIAYQQTIDGKLLEEQRKDYLKEKTQEKIVAQNLGKADTGEASMSSVPISIPNLEYLKDESIKYVDPLAEESSCLRDIPLLVDLHVNMIRVYSINPLANHDACMNALAEAGIYVISDLSEPHTSINRAYPSWDTEIFDRYKSVVDALAKYNNILGFFAGNEVANDISNTDSTPFVKAAVRDIKAYIKQRKYRKIPVGYSSNDDAETRANLANYFVCGEDLDATVDFYGINMYEWCGYSSYFSSGYSERTIEFQNYTVPIFFSEFGCNLVRPRPFQEVEILFSPLMTNVWSGGIVYMFFEEENKYGLVKVDQQTSLVKKLDDYRFLRDAYKLVNPKLLNAKDLPPPKPQAVNCPLQSDMWKAHEKLPQTPYNFKCECLETSLECIVSPSKKKHNFSKLYGILCNEVDCSEISGNGTTGKYGYYSDCDDKQKLSYLLNNYYLKNNRDPKSCDFRGEAFLNTHPTQQDLASISKNGESCANLLKDFSDNEGESDRKIEKSKSNGNSGGNSNSKPTSEATRLTVASRACAILSTLAGMYLLSRVI